MQLVWRTIQLLKTNKEKKIFCAFQLYQNKVNSPNVCFVVAGSIQVSHEIMEKDTFKSGSFEKFIGDYIVCTVTNNFILKKMTIFKPY